MLPELVRRHTDLHMMHALRTRINKAQGGKWRVRLFRSPEFLLNARLGRFLVLAAIEERRNAALTGR